MFSESRYFCSFHREPQCLGKIMAGMDQMSRAAEETIATRGRTGHAIVGVMSTVAGVVLLFVYPPAGLFVSTAAVLLCWSGLKSNRRGLAMIGFVTSIVSLLAAIVFTIMLVLVWGSPVLLLVLTAVLLLELAALRWVIKRTERA